MTGARAPRRPLVFVGRHLLPVPAGAWRADDWETAPGRLLPLLNQASGLVLADPLAFPYEALRPADREIPVAVALPALPPDEVEVLLGRPLLDHLGPGDRVAARAGTWEPLADRRRWSAEMRLESPPDDPQAVVEEALLPGVLGERSAKEEGRRRATALSYLLGGSGRPRERGGPVLDLEGRSGRWRHLLPVGLDLVAAAAAAPLPEADGSVEAAVALGVLGGLPSEQRPALVSEMWRVTRPGGLLAVVDDVVPIPGSGQACPFPRGGVPRLLLEATGRRVALGRVRSMRFPGEALHRAAGISVVKVGEPQEW